MAHASHSPDATANALPPELPPADTTSLTPSIVFVTGPKYECVECELRVLLVSMHPIPYLVSDDFLPHAELI